jgi:hypothetical protein
MSEFIDVGKCDLALVDSGDLGLLKAYRWVVHKTKHLRYAEASIGGERVKMHRLLLGLHDKQEHKATCVDHINGDGLDNRRSNLRLCTQGENSRNIHRAWGESQNRGVIKSREKWRARIRFNYRLIDIGTFDTEGDAVRAYAFASRVLFGEFGNPIARENGLSISESAGESLE